VSPDKGFFHCFGCQKHGDVFTFVMELEGKSFVEAAEQLGSRFGIEVPKIDESPELRRARGSASPCSNSTSSRRRSTRILDDPKRGEPGRAYLATSRRQETSDKFLLGYAPADWGLLADHLNSRRADLELAVKVGLIAHRPRSGGYYDRNRDRLVCPVVVPGGDVVGFSSRVVGAAPPAADGSEPPKYINSPESIVYKKSKLLFGLAQAREAMGAHKRAVLVEGNFDVITLHQAGFTEVVAPLGTALTPEQVNVLKRLAERVVLLYDGDRAGYKATMHALQRASRPTSGAGRVTSGTRTLGRSRAAVRRGRSIASSPAAARNARSGRSREERHRVFAKRCGAKHAETWMRGRARGCRPARREIATPIRINRRHLATSMRWTPR
jgi:DNA primase